MGIQEGQRPPKVKILVRWALALLGVDSASIRLKLTSPIYKVASLAECGARCPAGRPQDADLPGRLGRTCPLRRCGRLFEAGALRRAVLKGTIISLMCFTKYIV